MACLDFEFLEEWILFVIASYCELKTDKRRLIKKQKTASSIYKNTINGLMNDLGVSTP